MDDEICTLDEFLNPTDEEILEAACEVVFLGSPGGMGLLADHMRESINVCRGIQLYERKTYWHGHWGYQYKQIPPKHATCSSRRRGRPCKKRK